MSAIGPSQVSSLSVDSVEKCSKPADLNPKMSLDVKNSPPKMQDYPLPPPPPPDPPFNQKTRQKTIKLDGVDVPIREHIDRLKRTATTKSGVTEEARRVLEQFLKHSLQRGLKSPYSSELQTQSEREYLDECPYTLLQSNESYYGASHYGNVNTGTVEEKRDIYFDEPDYAEPAEPDEEDSEEFEQIPETQEDIDAALGHTTVIKTNSVSSQSSFGLSLRSRPASRNRSPSDRLFLSVHPPQIKGNNKGKSKKHKGLYDESSSSTEDYEYTESYLMSRKKKSFFKWASERLRQSFRRSHKGPELIEGDIDSCKGSNLITVPLPEDLEDVKLKKGKKNKLKFNLKRNGSDKGSKSTHSSTSPNDGTVEGLQVHHEGMALSEGELASYRIHEDAGYTLERASSTERRRKSPVPWKRYEIKTKKKDSLPAEAGKEKGIFDSFLRHIRKGSAKLKRKGSKADDSVRQRSRSADNLVIRPLSKEHEKLLQRYTRQKEPEYDSDNTTVRSFHEVGVHRVEQVAPLTPKPGIVWYPPPLPPEPPHSDDEGLQSLRRELQLEGLVPCIESTDPHFTLKCVQKQQILHRRGRPSESEDDVDGRHILRKPPRRKPCFSQLTISDKPFNEKSELEKEELYEKIAEQLAMIADQYNFESPRSSKSLSSPMSHSHTHSRSHSNSAPSQSETEEGAVGSSEQPVCQASLTEVEDHKQLEEHLHMLLQGEAHSTATMDIPPVISELVRNASYSKFKQIFNENIGNEPGWQQVAMMFRLTQTAVQLAGFGTAAALQIKEMTLKYFEDKFAGWIVGQGGWESVVEDTENDSELD